MNILMFFVRDKFIICLVMDFILFNLVVFHVLLLCINKVIVFMMIVHMMNMVIWVFKLDRVDFGKGQGIVA